MEEKTNEEISAKTEKDLIWFALYNMGEQLRKKAEKSKKNTRIKLAYKSTYERYKEIMKKYE